MTSRPHQTHTLGSGSAIWRKPGCWFLEKQLEMHFVKWPPVYVKHTLSTNGTFHWASRLHQMHIRKIECRLAYGKCYLFWNSDVSSTPNAYFGRRADPNGAEPGRAGWWWPRLTNSPITQNSFCKKKKRLVYTKRLFCWLPIFEA